MSFKQDLNLFVGAKYGVFKGLKITENEVLIKKNIQSLQYLSKEHDITAMAWSDESEEGILLGLSNQTVKVYDSNDKAFDSSTDVRIVEEDPLTKKKKVVSSGSICGLTRYDGAMITAVESGHIGVWRYEGAATINTGGPLSRMRSSHVDSNVLGTGGEENELKLWDINTKKNIFSAKNVPPDFLQMRVPVWVNDLTFFPNSDNVAVGSRYGYVRLYDPKAQKRPVVDVKLPEKAVTCITASPKDHTVLCGLAKGNIVAVDLRMGRSTKNYKGFLGAVKDISCHPTEPYVVSVGLDRFLRIHHLETKQLLHKEYIVSRASCLLLRSDVSLKPSKAKEEVKKHVVEESQALLSDGQSELEEYDELFDKMETVEESTQKAKKQKREAGAPVVSKKKKASLILNPFATPPATPKGTLREKKQSSTLKSAEPEEVERKIKPAQTESKPTSDSDDDIMIIEEVEPANMSALAEDGSESSDRDEAEGDSDELDEDDSDDERFLNINNRKDVNNDTQNSSKFGISEKRPVQSTNSSKKLKTV